MTVTFIPIVELDGNKPEKKYFGDERTQLKILSHPGDRTLITLNIFGIAVTLNAVTLLNAIQSIIQLSSTASG